MGSFWGASKTVTARGLFGEETRSPVAKHFEANKDGLDYHFYVEIMVEQKQIDR